MMKRVCVCVCVCGRGVNSFSGLLLEGGVKDSAYTNISLALY